MDIEISKVCFENLVEVTLLNKEISVANLKIYVMEKFQIKYDLNVC